MVIFLLLNAFLIAVEINIEIKQQKGVFIIVLQVISLITQLGIVFKNVQLVYLHKLLIKLVQNIVQLDTMLITKLIIAQVYATVPIINTVIILPGNVFQLVQIYLIFLLIQILKSAQNHVLEGFLLINGQDPACLLLIVQIKLMEIH
jgi:hypothetical protein